MNEIWNSIKSGWKAFVKPLVKFVAKYGINVAMKYAANAVKNKPEKGQQIAEDVASLGQLIKDDAEAIKDGEFDDIEQAKSNGQVEALIDRIFNY